MRLSIYNLLGLVDYFSKLSKELCRVFSRKTLDSEFAYSECVKIGSVKQYNIFKKMQKCSAKVSDKRYLLYLARNYPKIAKFDIIFYGVLSCGFFASCDKAGEIGAKTDFFFNLKILLLPLTVWKI